MDKGNSLIINAKQNSGEVYQASNKGLQYNKEDGLHAIFQQGQQVVGKAVDKQEFVTFDFQGKQVNFPANLYQDIQLGESKTFLVFKVAEQLIELKEVQDETEEGLQEGKKSAGSVRIEKDKDAYQLKKEQDQKTVKEEKVVHGLIGKMADILNKMTELDVMNFMKEGFSIDQMDIDQLYDGLNRMKEKTNSGLIKSEKLNGKTDIEQRLRNENMPVTKEGIQNIQSALMLSGIVPQINENTSHYLISNEWQPSIENIYKAHFNGNANPYQVTNPLTEDAWNQLKPQIEQVIHESGLDVNDKTLSDGKWLIESNLPITKENLIYKQELANLKDQWNEEQTLDKVIEGVKEGHMPKDTILGSDGESSYHKIMDKIDHIHGSTIEEAIQKEIPLTIDSLDRLQKQSEEDIAVEREQENVTNTTYEAIKAKRQLEEIRLKMTKEAVAALDKKGFSIETESLEKVVEELKLLEKQYYQSMCEEAQVEPTAANIDIIVQTQQQVNQLKELPAYLLGRTLEDRLTQTIPSLVDVGVQMQSEMTRAGEAYDTLMTVPNGEYGDSIQKAFRNMEPLLDELKIQNTQANQRAVRMLAYNQMEITQENIDRMKVYDDQVSDLIENLNPAVTLQLIKDGINPLDVPVAELNQRIDELKEEQGLTTEDKYSVYLQKLEKMQGISESERKSYIGIYRLLYQVEKSDGAAIGTLVKQDREITLNHLLTAVKTIQKGRIDSVVDDDFGLLESTTRTKETIAEQIETAFQQEQNKDDIQKEERQEVRQELYQKVLKDLIDEISPEKLATIEQAMAYNQRNSEVVGMTQGSQEQIWNLIKDHPLDLLLEEMEQVQVDNQLDEEIAKANLSRLREIYQNGEQSVKFLNQYKVPQTPMNLQMANQVITNGSIDLKKILKEDENTTESLDNPLKEMTNLADNLIDKSSMNEAYDNLVALAKDALEQTCSRETVSTVELAQLKMIGAQMSFLKSLAQKEYYQIPVETQQGIVNMNLTIIHGSKDQGKISIAVQSDENGQIKADLTLNDGLLKGFVYCEGRKALEALKEELTALKQELSEDGITVKQIDFTLNRKEIDGLETTPYEHTEVQEKNHQHTEKDLYKVAKAFVKAMQQIHRTE